MEDLEICEQIERLLEPLVPWMESGELQELRVTGDGAVFAYGAETAKAEIAFAECDRDRLTRLVAAYFGAEIHAEAPDLSAQGAELLLEAMQIRARPESLKTPRVVTQLLEPSGRVHRDRAGGGPAPSRDAGGASSYRALSGEGTPE